MAQVLTAADARHLARAGLATRLCFFVAGFVLSCWAPLVPFAKDRVGLDAAALGFMLLCGGLGSAAALVIARPLTDRLGSASVVGGAGLVLSAALPFLAVADGRAGLASALFLFGLTVGVINLVANIQAVEVERRAARPLMSGFHALFSIGAIGGAGASSLLLSAGAGPAGVAALASLLVLGLLALTLPRFLPVRAPHAGPLFALPRGIVLPIGCLVAVMLLVEGSLLDWGALLLIDTGLAAAERAGLGFVAFALAMATGRIFGDRLATCFGDGRLVRIGGLVAVAGLLCLLAASHFAVAIAGFALVGLGASNIVPIFYRSAGSQDAMPAASAISAVATMGFAGILAGPALIGFIAGKTGLHAAFLLLAAILCLVPLGGVAIVRRAARGARSGR